MAVMAESASRTLTPMPSILHTHSHFNIYTFIRHEDRMQHSTEIKTDRQTHTQALHLILQHDIKKENHIVLVLECSYTTHVNSLKFMHITDTPYK